MKKYIIIAVAAVAVVQMFASPASAQEFSKISETGSKGRFVITGAMYLPIYGSSYDKCAFEELTVGYSFLNNSFNSGLSLGHLSYGDGVKKYNAGTVMAYISYGIGTMSEKFSLYPILELGVAHGAIDYVRKRTRFAGGFGMTLMYRPIDWLRTGLDVKYMGFANSDSSWLMLGLKIGFEF